MAWTAVACPASEVRRRSDQLRKDRNDKRWAACNSRPSHTYVGMHPLSRLAVHFLTSVYRSNAPSYFSSSFPKPRCTFYLATFNRYCFTVGGNGTTQHTAKRLEAVGAIKGDCILNQST